MMAAKNIGAVRIVKRNRFAKAISYFVVHVPSGSKRTVSVSFLPVKLCNSSYVIGIPLKEHGKGFLIICLVRTYKMKSSCMGRMRSAGTYIALSCCHRIIMIHYKFATGSLLMLLVVII